MGQDDSNELLEEGNTAPPLKSSALPGQELWFPATLFVWYLITYVLLPIPPVRLDLDESWRAFLGWAFEHGKQFGTEVIFTYGPWGFLLEPRGTISLYPWQVLGRLVLASGASWGIALLGISWIRSRVLRLVWAGAIVILAEPSVLIPMLLFLCAMGQAGGRWKRPPLPGKRAQLRELGEDTAAFWALLPIAFAAGLAACTKLTCFMLVATLLPLIAWKRDLATVATAVGSFLFFWALAGQRLSNLPEFVKQSIEISSGYTTAMVNGRPGIELPLALVVCALPLVQVARQIRLSVTLPSLAGLGWLAFYDLLTFRHTLIRTDPYHSFAGLINAGIPLVLLLIPLPDRSKERAASSSRWKVGYRILAYASLAAAIGTTWPEIERRGAFLMESFRLCPVYAREARSLWRREQIPSERGSVDIFPVQLSYAIQKNLPLRNRPVIQAYSAFTRELCEKDAAFFESRSAPESVYFKVDPIDGHYPYMEDSLVWRSLFTNYVASSLTDGYLVLKRRESPVEIESKLLLDRGIRTEEFLEVPATPANGWIWVEVKVRRTLRGALLDLLYRNEKMVLQVETTRRLLDFRFLDETAAIGFLLSPYGDSLASMREVFQPEGRFVSAEEVRRIRLRRGNVAALGFSPDIRVRLYALTPKGSTAELQDGGVEDQGRIRRAGLAKSVAE